MSGRDDELLVKAVAGEREALGMLLTRHGGDVRQALSGAISPEWRSMVDEDDVLQVTYLEAFLQIKKLQPSGMPAFVAWLRRIAENNLQDAIRGLTRAKRPDPRRQVRQARTDDSVAALYDLVGEDSMTPSRDAAGHERRHILEKAMEQLPTDYRSVLQMYDLDGRSVNEVAKAMSRSPGAVYMLRARAVEGLRRLLPSVSAMYSRSA
ncbi:MAG TPA: sigma-70 family RNA polymerase sigma factor [Phycisphaerae bacterium]|nr:sigma-70 family RNA polymerase sigma factor [Phycisphaerae bacterium]